MQRIFLLIGLVIPVGHEAKAATHAELLWVVDNSGSMLRFQKELGTAIDGFFDALKAERVEWNLTLVSSSRTTQANAYRISSLETAPGKAFRRYLKEIGVHGDVEEEFARPALAHLPPADPFQLLAFVFFTDQVSDAGSQAVCASRFLSQVYQKWEVVNVLTQSFVASAEFACVPSEGTAKGDTYRGSFFHHVNRHTGGTAYPRCGSSDAGGLKKSLQDAARRIAERAREVANWRRPDR